MISKERLFDVGKSEIYLHTRVSAISKTSMRSLSISLQVWFYYSHWYEKHWLRYLFIIKLKKHRRTFRWKINTLWFQASLSRYGYCCRAPGKIITNSNWQAKELKSADNRGFSHKHEAQMRCIALISIS